MALRGLLLAALLAACLTWSASALDVRGRLIVPEPNFARVSLNGGQHVGLVRRDGVFVIHDVVPGVYLLDVHSKTYVFSRVRLTLQASGQAHAVEFKYPGAAKAPISYPLVMKPQTVPVYFPVRKAFNPLSYLKNPMVIIMLVAMGMMFLPKLMGEEAMEEMKKQQEEMGDQGGLAGMLGIQVPKQGEEDESSDDEPDINAALPGIDGLGTAANTPSSSTSSASRPAAQGAAPRRAVRGKRRR